MDPLSIIGGLTAGIQLVSTAAEALLATIKLLKDLKEVPKKLALLLVEVEDSISRLCQSCNPGSTIFQRLNPDQLNRLSRSVTALYPALREIRNMLLPLFDSSSDGKGVPVRRLWNSFVSLKVESELSDKLTRLNRLNTEVIRDLALLGVEMQTSTNGLLIANSESSRESFSTLETKMDSLRSDFQAFTLSVQQTHAITLARSDELDHRSRESSPPPSHSGLAEISDLAIDDPELRKQRKGSPEREELMRRYLSGDSNVNISAPSPVIKNSQHANLEFILFNIRTFYTVGNFDPSNMKSQAQFWKDTKLAIYLVKSSKSKELGSIKSENRGLKLLKQSSSDAASHLSKGTASLLIELLSTLSPTNTAICSFIRDALLQYLDGKARYQLGPDHPVTLVIRILRMDNGEAQVSLQALELLTDRLRSILGPAHELPELATRRLCALLRRNGDYDQALRVGSTGVRAIRAHLGCRGSLPERMLMRQMEQVYMAEEDWVAALSICFEIVGQRDESAGANPDPTRHDECAVYTMEDIAKICECSGNLTQAVAWLKQARISGGMVWCRTEALGHIQDKLLELLAKMGNEQELELWKIGFGDEVESEAEVSSQTLVISNT